MFTKNTLGLLVASLLALSFASTTHAESCMPIGGVAIPNFFSEGEGKPMIISATLTGSMQNAAGKIISQRQTSTGLEMDMEHYFGKDDGGAFQTKDLGILTSIPGKPGRYMLEITYHIQENVTRGTLRGYKGHFNSYGLVDLRDPENLVGLVRYTGSICK